MMVLRWIDCTFISSNRSVLLGNNAPEVLRRCGMGMHWITGIGFEVVAVELQTQKLGKQSNIDIRSNMGAGSRKVACR